MTVYNFVPDRFAASGSARQAEGDLVRQDRLAAWQDAVLRKSLPAAAKGDSNPVDATVELGQKLGVRAHTVVLSR